MNKELILCISPEWMGGGCGVLRVQQTANYINQNHKAFGVKIIVSPEPIFDNDILSKCRCIYIQRPFGPWDWIKRYRELQPKYGYGIVGEVDDNFTKFKGEGLPDYHPNSVQPRDWDLIDKLTAENLTCFDRMITATDYLGRVLREKFGFYNTVTVPNVCERALWSRERKNFFREKPLILSASAMQHYRTPIPMQQQAPTGVTGLRGDYTGEWVEWIIEHIDDFDVHYFADRPYFFDSVADKITIHPWQSTDLYIGEYNRIRPDIVFAPLKNNIFNRCKSRLKFTECCASGAILMGSVFEDSPYCCIHPLCQVPDEPTKDQLTTVYNNIVTHWKEIIDWQYEFINKNGEWLESEDHLNKWLTACTLPNRRII